MVNSIYCSNEKIQVVVGNTSKNNINIKSSKDIILPEGTLLNGVILDAEALRDILSQELKNSGIKGKDVALVIDSTSILTKMIKAPNISPKNIHKIIKMEFETARNNEEFIYDYYIINPKNPEGGATIFACAVAKSFVEAYDSLFKSIGYKAVSIDIIQSAVIKLVENFGLFKNETCTLIINDGNSIVLNLFVNGIYMLSTRYRLMEKFGTSDYINEVLGRISVHTQFIATQKLEYKISKIYFCGNYGEDVDISSELKNTLDIESSELDLDEKINNYVYAIGNTISIKNKEINLVKQLSVNHEKKEEQKKKTIILLPIFSLLAIVIAIYFGIFALKVLTENKTETQKNYIEDSQNQEKYGEYLSYVQATNNYSKILSELKAQDELLSAFPDLSEEYFVKIETCATGLITLNEMTYTISEEDGTFFLELTGVSDNVNNIVSFIGNLENQEITYKNNGYYLAGDKYEFSVICILESDIVLE